MDFFWCNYSTDDGLCSESMSFPISHVFKPPIKSLLFNSLLRALVKKSIEITQAISSSKVIFDVGAWAASLDKWS